MYSIGSLNIAGFRGKQVPNTFFRQDGETDHVAIVFPGYAYRCYGPVLYYPTLAALSLRADVLWVEYAYDREPEYQKLRLAERREWSTSDSRAAAQSAVLQRSYRRITMIGKSIGTLAMGHLLTEEPRLGSSRAIWLTPLLGNERLRTELEGIDNPSLFVSGSADSEYNPEFAARLRGRRGMKFLLLDGADHSLEIPGDVFRSLQILKQLVESILGFLKE